MVIFSMNIITDSWDFICEVFADLIRAPIVWSVENLFTGFVEQLNTLGALVSLTPKDYLGGYMFDMVEKIQEKAVLPVAVIILTLVMCYELISMIIDKNNMADFPISDFLKWIFKSVIAILFLDKSFIFVCAIFELAQDVVTNSASVLATTIDDPFNPITESVKKAIDEEKNWFALIGTFLLTWILRIVMIGAGVVINAIVALRMIEIHMMISLAPIPFATLGNREFGQIGQNYIKSIFALAFQSFFMFMSIALFGGILNGMLVGGDLTLQLVTAVGYCIIFCLTFGKVGSYSNRVFGTS